MRKVRSDDANVEVIRARILEYHNKTVPVANHYAKVDKFKKVKGDGTIDETFALLCQEMDRLVEVTA
jgi:adenylate kinase